MDPCHYGLERPACHLGCGRWCRPARRAAASRSAPHNPVQHDKCGTPECCRVCDNSLTTDK